MSQLKKLYPEKTVLFEKVYVRVRSTIEKGFKRAIDIFGKIDIVINGAAIADEKNYVNVIQVNLLGFMHVTEVALDHISISKGGEGGMIWNISYALGLDHMCCLAAYTATKYALLGYVSSLSDKRLEK